jgi:hypothetical protein
MILRVTILSFAMSIVLVSCGKSESKVPPDHKMKSVKIRTLSSPHSDLSSFDPGKYLCDLEFYETSDAITNADRDGLAQFVHFLAFMALQAKSNAWEHSTVRRDATAFRALESHFGHLKGWEAITQGKNGLSYRQLVSFLMDPYPPRLPK